MPVAVSESDLAATRAFLKTNRLTRLRCSSRAGAIIVESGPKDDALSLLRLKKLASNRWAVDEFHHTGRWAPLPIQGPLDDALAAVLADFSWALDG